MMAQQIQLRAAGLAVIMLLGCGGRGNIETATSASTTSSTAAKKILFFVSYDNTYYSEYKVAYEGLRAAGYGVDVRSAATGSADSYSASGDGELTRGF